MTFSHKTETNHRCSSFAASKKAVLQPSLGIASLAYERGRVNKLAVSVMTFSSLQNPVCWAGKIHMSPMSDMLSLSFMAFQYVITSPRHARCGFTQKVQQRNPLIPLFSCVRALEPPSPSPVFSPTSVTTPPSPPPLPPPPLESKGGVFCCSHAKGWAGGRGLAMRCYVNSFQCWACPQAPGKQGSFFRAGS